jgi:hypothetical protein
MYNFTNATAVTLLQSQTENPYWIRNRNGTPACDAHAMVIKDSRNVTFFGTVVSMSNSSRKLFDGTLTM